MRFTATFAIIGGPLWPGGSPCAAAESKPNIVLINGDDLGWKHVGYQGTDFYETPNIDRLVMKGMVFSSGYAGAGSV